MVLHYLHVDNGKNVRVIKMQGRAREKFCDLSVVILFTAMVLLVCNDVVKFLDIKTTIFLFESHVQSYLIVIDTFLLLPCYTL